MEKKANYKEAYAELQEILQDLQAELIDIDQLSEKLERARVLVAFCKEKLRSAEEKLQQD